MRTEKDVEAYLTKMNRRFSPMEDKNGTYLLRATSESVPPIALHVDPPLVVTRVNVGQAPREGAADFYRKLLSLNASTLVHTSFGLEEDNVVLTSALELENLDYNELEALLDEIDVTLAQQVPGLAALAEGKPSS
jgi:hypothetical protein